MQCLNFLNPRRDSTINQLQSLSANIEKKLSINIPDVKIDKLSAEELQDINKIVGLANYMLIKYEDKKETRLLLEQFVSLITESAQSVECIDDEISELILSAENSINKVKTMHTKLSADSDLKKSYLTEFADSESEIGSINLTNFTRAVNTSEYQQKSQERTVQMI
ncbi:hypothetical protein [Candidatus Nitrosarchaeum limnium]|jgi:hypothetical protein|uniref:hypothetical protein n=1 Tax=Candidatus Nitrosarchaeum limnium TaxID=1007084 RepID=UPI00064F5471|nr:hypothetical protein [Candidatus Nitrosarchaeum limnium]